MSPDPSPGPLAERLADVQAAWGRQQAAAATLNTLRDGAPIEADELAEARRLGLSATLDARWHAIIPQRFHRAALTDLAGVVERELAEWAFDPRGRNLIITGPVGTGKTHAAVAACRPAHDRGLDVAFLPVIELLDALRPSGPGDDVSISDVAAIDRLILDDLGAQRDTDWTHERLEAVINRRWLEERPTIITTNLDGKALAERFRESTFSRLVGGAVTLRLSGADRRRER